MSAPHEPPRTAAPRYPRARAPADKILDAAGLLALAALWALVVLSYPQLPATIATHFGAGGRADGWGPKATLAVLPGIATAIFLGLTILIRFPHVFNYPVANTAENAERQYMAATRLLRGLKTAIPMGFALIVWKTGRMSGGDADALGRGFLALEIFILAVPLIGLVAGLLRRRRGKPVG